MTVSTAATWSCPPRTILVGVDFGEASARALEAAGVLAAAFGSSVRALHAERFEPPPYFTMEQIARLEAERRAAQEAAADHLAAFAGRAEFPVEPLVVDQPPVEAILGAAPGTDLIVVGTHGRRGPGRWWLGSVAERVVRAASVPVLVTRAAASPPLEILSRLALVQEGAENAAARACVRHLSAIAHGEVIEGGTITTCNTDVVRQASLVVIAKGGDSSAWTLSDPSARVLTSCEAPVLFIPAS